MFKRLYDVDDSLQKDLFLVKELVTFERFCRDQSLWIEMKKCFHPESTVCISWYKGSGQGFIEASEKMKGFAPHKINHMVARCNGDRAVAECITSIQMRQKLQGQWYYLTSYARLHYRLVRERDCWLILSLTGIYEKDTVEPAYCIGTPQPLDFDPEGYRPSYAALCYFFEKSGMTFYDDLPGIDRPEMVNALYESSGKWLSEA